jgi:23S rRNA (pseudouridine1915-N3)-methyltransferase
MNQGYEEYASRLKGDYRLELKEIPLGHRGSGDPAQSVAKEGERMLAALPSGAYVVALQVHGRTMSSEQLAAFLQARALDARPLVFCIGGPEGLAPEVDLGRITSGPCRRSPCRTVWRVLSSRRRCIGR